MKKIAFIFTAVAAIVVASCNGNSTANVASNADTDTIVTDTIDTIVIDSANVDTIAELSQN